MRGSRRPIERLASTYGSIPASAGEPGDDSTRFAYEGVYPRECGGAQKGELKKAFGKGLSPRVRGSRFVHTEHSAINGSIPASAGEPSRPGSQDSKRGVYPRECGGASSRERVDIRDQGLSPRVRGSRVAVVGREERNGSIPASAGEPLTSSLTHTPCGVYPRECGGAST